MIVKIYFFDGKKRKFSISHRELTAAISLVVEVVLLDNLEPAFLKAAFPPVLRPERDIGVLLHREITSLLDLFEAFPPTRRQSCGNHRKAVLMSISRSPRQPVFETFQASPAAFRLIFQTRHLAAPFLMVVVVVDDLQTERLRVARALIFPDFILLERVNIGVAVIYIRCHAVLHQAFDDCRRARGAACVKQHFVGSARHFHHEFLFHIFFSQKYKIIQNND